MIFLNKGFTLIEQIVALSILSIISTIGLPMMFDFMQNQKQLVTGNELVASLNLARQSAVTNYRNVVMCPSDNQISCSNVPNWQHGWLIFIDNNKNRELDQQERLIHSHSGAKEPTKIISSKYRKRIRFMADGSSPGTNATLVICNEQNEKNARSVVISNAGRARQGKPSAKQVAMCLAS